MQEINDRSPLNGNHVCLNSFKTHWAQAQIDGPMRTVSRYDDVSKLLITIGGFVLGALATAFSAVLNEKTNIEVASLKSRSKWIFFLMLIYFVCAALVCYFQPKMKAWEIMNANDDASLSVCINDWCKNIQKVISYKESVVVSRDDLLHRKFSFMMFFLLAR